MILSFEGGQRLPSPAGLRRAGTAAPVQVGAAGGTKASAVRLAEWLAGGGDEGVLTQGFTQVKHKSSVDDESVLRLGGGDVLSRDRIDQGDELLLEVDLNRRFRGGETAAARAPDLGRCAHHCEKAAIGSQKIGVSP